MFAVISCLGAPTRHLLMPRDPFQLSSVVTSQYSKIFILEKVSGKSPESFPESLPIWVKRAQQRQIVDHASKEIFVNHFKIISSQDENIRDEAIEKGWI